MQFIFEQIRVGGDRNFAYLIGDRKARVAAIVDPSGSPEMVVARATAQQLEIKLILNTHGHQDHTSGNARARQLTGALVAAHPRVPFRPDVPLEDGRELAVGSVKIRALHVPGHTADHVVLHLPGLSAAITGDLLFVGKVGGTASEEEGRAEHASLLRLLRELPDSTTIWPGHDYGCRPSSTIFLEKITNPFLLAAGIDEFLRLKEEWPEFKAAHGLV